jgi:cytochrome c peroxidase
MKYFLFSCFLLSILSCSKPENKSFEEQIRVNVDNKIDSILYYVGLVEKGPNFESIKLNYVQCRKVYKKIEPFIEYYYQGFSRRINGPALPDIEIDDNKVVDPSGFQVLEEIIYADSIDVARLRSQLNILKTDFLFIKNSFKELPIQDHHLYELLQHQIIRIATLGISGFDSPVSFQSLNEVTYAINGISEYYRLFILFKGKKADQKIVSAFSNSVSYISNNNDFDKFNRLEFIKLYLMPLSKDLKNEFNEYIDQSKTLDSSKVFFGTLDDLMKGNNFQADKFSPYADAKMTSEKILLGKSLFNDAILSQTKTMSCATCHSPSNYFMDQKVASTINVHNNTVQRNSPTILYAAFQKSFFYDLRSQDLENQIESVLTSTQEFNINPTELEYRIKSKPELNEQFKLAYPNNSTISTFELKNAIASYVRSLMPFSSKFDNYFKSDSSLTSNEINGFNLFTGKAKCGTCHFVPLFNGTIPPWYTTSESEVIGVPMTSVWTNAIIDDDLGRFYTNPVEQFKYSFKTPTVRNISKTAPYMHNGVYTNLNDVIKFYELGGGNGIGMNLLHQTLPFDNLKLSALEKEDIIKFLYTLTDKNE